MVLLTGLAAYYAMDSTTDASGNGHTLTNYGATFITGKIGNAYNFNNGQRLVGASFSSMGISNKFTTSFWINTPGANAYNFVISTRGGHGFVIYLSATTFELWNGAAYLYAVPSTPIIYNTWNYYTLTYDGSLVKVYLNSNLVSTQTYSGNLGSLTTPLQIGYDGMNNMYFIGSLDELGIWNRALTQAEITTLYNGGTGLTYPFSTGYSKKVNGITPSKVNGIAVANISKVNGI